MSRDRHVAHSQQADLHNKATDARPAASDAGGPEAPESALGKQLPAPAAAPPPTRSNQHRLQRQTIRAWQTMSKHVQRGLLQSQQLEAALNSYQKSIRIFISTKKCIKIIQKLIKNTYHITQHMHMLIK